MERSVRTRPADPAGVPWPAVQEQDVVLVDTTWGELQPLQCAPGVVTVGELELTELVANGALLVDTRVPDSRKGRSIPGAVNLPHDRITELRGRLDPSRLSILFCNGPQCPQSPMAIRDLLEAGYPASALAYYRGGLHDWVTLAMPLEQVG